MKIINCLTLYIYVTLPEIHGQNPFLSFLQRRNTRNSPASLNEQISVVRKPRFSFFNEFIEPLPDVLRDIFPRSTRSDSDPIVETENGLVRGMVKESRSKRKYFAFLGLPFAKAPIKELRFEPPQKFTEKWTGVRNAVEYKNPCFHMDVFFSGRLIGNENCLFANFYTPTLDYKAKLPVCVYIHGGGFMAGSGDFYQEKYFMDENVVFVIFNYRLAALGFLNSGDGLINGNMGLKDQNMLLQYVKANIEMFGGDKDNVLLFGESAGAAATTMHMISKRSQGLFHKAVAISGSALCPWSFNGNPAASFKRLAKHSGCPTHDSKSMVKCLKKLPVKAFAKEYKEMMKTVTNPAEYFAPSAEILSNEDTFMTKHPREILSEGLSAKIPLMMGVSSGEGLLFLVRNYMKSNVVSNFVIMFQGILADKYAMKNFDKKFSSWIPRYLYYDPDNTTTTSTLRSIYFPYGPIDLYRTQDFLNLTNLLSDGMFFHPIREFLKLYGNSAKNSTAPSYLYYNNYQGRLSVFDVMRKLPVPNFSGEHNSIQSIPEISIATELLQDLLKYRLTNRKPSEFGTSHGDSVMLLFNNRNVPGIGRFSIDYDTSRAFVKAIVDCAKADLKNEKRDSRNLLYNGIPWPPVSIDQEKLKYMQIELPSQLIEEPFYERMKTWDEKLHQKS